MVPSSRKLPLVAAVTLALVALVAPAVESAPRLLGGGRSPVFFGISVPGDDPALLARAGAAAGVAPTVDNIFVKLDSTSFGTASLRRIAARGMRPMVSLEPWSYRSTWGQTAMPDYDLASVATGMHDRQLRALAGAVAAFQEPVYLRFAHEMNGWWYPWAVGQNGNTPPEYVRAWRHVRQLFRTAGATNAAFVWSPNALTGSGRETPLEFAYPGDPYVDLVGMTAYGHGTSPAATFDPTYARLTALTGKPIVLTETGVDGPGKAAWIAAFGEWLAKHERVTGFVWFNTTPASTGASGDYRFDDTPANAAAFRRALAAVRPNAPSG